MTQSRFLPRPRLLVVTLLASLCSVGIAVAEDEKGADESAKTTTRVAHIELKGSYPEAAPMSGPFSSVSETLSTILGRLEKAAADDEIQTVMLEVSGPGVGWAKVNELRTAIQKIRDAGKTVYATLDDADTRGYLIASAADQVIMPESGTWMVLGVRAEVTFYKNLFDKLDINPEMLRIGEYKSAAEPYTRTEMSPEFREEMQEIVDGYYDLLVGSIAKSRSLKPDAVKQAIDSAPLTMEEAKKAGLIDHIAYSDQIDDLIKKQTSTEELKIVKGYGKQEVDKDFSGISGMVKMMNILAGVEPKARKTLTPKVAVIYATGVIMTGKSTTSLLSGDVMGSDTIIKAIEKVKADDSIKAVVLRVDSPGGSALASDLMWRSLQTLDKPLVVSMGDTAASGGYYIAMGADTVFAEPGTLTGSIGVVGGKLAMKGLYNKVGMTTSVISRGKNAGVMSPLEGFSDSEREAMYKLLRSTYKQFVSKAAAGRDMEYDNLEKLARGRVYLGKRAVELNLVDELGTLEDAIAKAKTLGKIDADQKTERIELPTPPSPLEALLGPLEVTASPVQGLGPEAAVLREFAPEMKHHLSQLEAVRLLTREPKLTLLPFRLNVR